MLITGYRVLCLLRTYSELLQRFKLSLTSGEGELETACAGKVIPEEVRQRMAIDLVTSKALEQVHSEPAKGARDPTRELLQEKLPLSP